MFQRKGWVKYVGSVRSLSNVVSPESSMDSAAVGFRGWSALQMHHFLIVDTANHSASLDKTNLDFYSTSGGYF